MSFKSEKKKFGGKKKGQKVLCYYATNKREAWMDRWMLDELMPRKGKTHEERTEVLDLDVVMCSWTGR